MKTSVITSIAILSLLISLPQCKSRKSKDIEINPAFSSIISAFTSGNISVQSSVLVVLSEEYQQDVEPNDPVDEDVFSFSPNIKGSSFWIDNRTIEFRPEENLKPNTSYQVAFYVSKIAEVPRDLKTFEFSFQTIKQSFAVDMEGLTSYSKKDLTWYYITGQVRTADIAKIEEVTDILKATQNKKNLEVSWTPGDNQASFRFQIDSIKREEKAGEVQISWNGKSIGVDKKNSERMEIPAMGDFKILDAKVVLQPKQHIRIQFSDPILKKQNLDGLIHLQSNTLKFIVEDNVVKAYPNVRQKGSVRLTVESGVKNILGYRLKTPHHFDLLFEQIKPAIKLLGNGVILPNSEGLTLPFQAVNLKAVNVSIIKIYENNIAQFLQINQLDGSQQMKRAGRLVKKKTIKLNEDQSLEYGKWNTFSLDLTKLVQTDPGAIYRVELGFQKKHSLYPCEGDEDDTGAGNLEEIEENWDETGESDLSYWDGVENYYGEYDYEYDYYYDWEDREDPCKKAYYGKQRNVARNILASNLGIIAKGGSGRNIKVVITDLVSTQPMPGVLIEILNYQQQIIGKAQTDNQGFASIETEGKPFLLVAKKETQRGYLRMDDGSSLSLSKFDVSGNVVQKGIKGFLYGERGVWRPGDSLYLTFILEDKKNILPENHPVSFELFNPMGQLVKRITSVNSVNGFYRFHMVTDADAPTGNWLGKVKVGGSLFTKEIKIETVKPNRLKISIDFGVEKLRSDDKSIKGTLSAKWLHGAIARNLEADVRVNLFPRKTAFPKYSDYVFDDPSRKFDMEEQSIFDGNINEKGEAGISSDINVRNAAPGMLTAQFVTYVYEESGEFSVDRFSLPYSPFSSYVGIKPPKGDKARGMLLTDTTHTIHIVTLDPDGKPKLRKKLEAKVYKVEWRWWWDSGSDDIASYSGSSYSNEVASAVISTNARGEGVFNFRINYPDWGRYLIHVYDPESGHATGKIVYIDWPGWAGRAERENPGGASMLVFTADKQKYQVGETATLTIPTSGQGRALVSLENGSSVLETFWVETKDKETRVNFKISEQMAPNIYAHVSLIQPHAQSVNDLPIRLYGIIPIFVEDSQTRLEPQISMPDVLRPEENVKVKVKEKSGNPMTYTIAMVDEGLLDLTRFTTPDPWSVFYARESLGVKTWDMYDMVLGAYGGKIEQLFAIGGGLDEENGSKDRSANRFKPVVRFYGPFHLKKGKTASHTIPLPRYVGSVKTMVVAANEGAYGSAEKVTPVRKPLMVLATLPRVLGPGESVKLPVTLFAMEENLKDVTVEITHNEMFIPQGSKNTTVKFEAPGDKVVNFELKIPEKIGIGKISVIAKSGKETARYDIEIDVRNPNPPITELQETVIDPGKTWESAYPLPGITGTNTGVLELSTIPPVDFGRRLKYLLGYPHGCVEQTTSAAFPQLFLKDVIDLNQAAADRAEENVKIAIERLKTFQLSNGGFGYWPNSDDANDWSSSYAGHFLLEAGAKGYALPPGVKENWLKYQKKVARQWSPPKGYKGYFAYARYDLAQAYRLYTLALAGEPMLAVMNRLRERNDLTLQAKWRLAAAYALAGQKEVAKEITSGLGTQVPEYEGASYTYGSRERDLAMILETLSLLGERDKGISIIKALSDRLSGRHWMSTQTTAYALLAISKFTGTDKTSKEMKFTYSLNSGKSINGSTGLTLYQVPMEVEKTRNHQVKITNHGNSTLFARIVLEGTPAIGTVEELNENISMDVSYTDMDGNTIDVSRLEQGTNVKAQVTLYNNSILGHYKDLALTQIFPGGWEIYNTRMDGTPQGQLGDTPSYQDIRDDRVYTYFDLPKGKSKTFVILLNASYLGKFYLPAVQTEAMYDDRIKARKPGEWVEVLQPGN